MPELAFRVNPVTAGTPSHKFEHLRVNYVYGGDKKDEPAPPPPTLGGLARTYERRQRTARFAVLRSQGISVLEAGKRVGVQPKTARTYERERLDAPSQEGTS